MSAFKSDFLNVLSQRGFIHQASDVEGLDALAAKGQATAYVGYDCTAPSLHIGNFLTMMMLYWLQQSGNKPITLMGGGTTMVGDPSGKDETRKLLTVDGMMTIEHVTREIRERDERDTNRAERQLSLARTGPFHEIGRVTTILSFEQLRRLHRALTSVEDLLSQIFER